MIIKYLFLFLPLSILYSCTEPSPEMHFRRERDKRIHHILRDFKGAMRTKGFHAAGIGEGVDHNTGKQNYLKVVFDIEKLPDIDFARKIEVETLQEFLHYINLEEGIQDYVAEYPFPLKFVRIVFISQRPGEGLFSVANFEEELYYDKDDPDKPIGPSIEVHQESYEDAVRILAQKGEA